MTETTQSASERAADASIRLRADDYGDGQTYSSNAGGQTLWNFSLQRMNDVCEVAASYAELEAKVVRLTGRGIEDMQHRIAELETALERIRDMDWGSPGYCGDCTLIATEALDGETP